MWPYPWTHVGTPSHLGHMDRVAATMPSQAHAGAAQEAPDIGQWEGQDVPLVRPSSCNVKGGIPSSRRYLPTYLPWWHHSGNRFLSDSALSGASTRNTLLTLLPRWASAAMTMKHLMPSSSIMLHINDVVGLSGLSLIAMGRNVLHALAGGIGPPAGRVCYGVVLSRNLHHRDIEPGQGPVPPSPT